jgi:hypothetical protein
MAAYLRFAREYYGQGGGAISEVAGVIHAMRTLGALNGHCNVSEFGPLALQTVRQRMIEGGLSRRVVRKSGASDGCFAGRPAKS